eukprot:753656-Hanusia_phi.AAC.23
MEWGYLVWKCAFYIWVWGPGGGGGNIRRGHRKVSYPSMRVAMSKSPIFVSSLLLASLLSRQRTDLPYPSKCA